MAGLNSNDEIDDNNAELQNEELEALSAIYGQDFVRETDNDEDCMYFEDNTGSKQGLLLSAMPTFSITIRPDNATDSRGKVSDAGSSSISQNSEARLIITFQPGYPTSSPPLYQLSIPWLRGGQKQLIANALEELYLEHLGESIVYIWVEKLRELLHVVTESSANPNNIPCGTESVSKQNTGLADLAAGCDEASTSTCTSTGAIDPFASEYLIDQFSNSLSFNSTIGAAGDSSDERASNLYDVESTRCTQKSQNLVKSLGQVPPIRTGTPLTDRKSTFQAHVAPVNDTSEIRPILDELYQNKKIATATHNMNAYRIFKTESKTWFQDCDDDGETHAGSRLLHLLQILDCRNVIVVVSRWYGGIQLHGDRFKHINNVARQALSEFGFIPVTDGKKVDDPKSKGSTKR